MASSRRAFFRRIATDCRIKPGTEVRLARDFDPARTPAGLDKQAAEAALAESVELLAEYQRRLAAQDTYGVVLVIQGIDAAGKDSTVQHVMSGVNPAGVSVHSFKVPSAEEWSHDYLWRFAQRLPRRGQIAIFNRSYYEEVLVVRVHPEILLNQHLPPGAAGPDLWKRRFREINDWERYLTDNGIKVVKVFLNLSYEEQRRRFLRRIDTPNKNWKFSSSDIKERRSWQSYQDAFDQMLSNTSTDHAPWHVVPADNKWFARLAVASILINELRRIDPKFPTPSPEAAAALEAARRELQAEATAAKRVRGRRGKGVA